MLSAPCFLNIVAPQRASCSHRREIARRKGRELDRFLYVQEGYDSDRVGIKASPGVSLAIPLFLSTDFNCTHGIVLSLPISNRHKYASIFSHQYIDCFALLHNPGKAGCFYFGNGTYGIARGALSQITRYFAKAVKSLSFTCVSKNKRLSLSQ